jgi:hypothetical protein
VPAYSVGQTIDLDPSVYGGAERTLVIFASGACSACQRFKPELSSLVSESQDDAGTSVKLVLSVDSADEAADAPFARDLGVAEADIVRMDLRQILLKRVPAVAVVDRQGRIGVFHEGEITPGVRTAIRTLLTAGSRKV